MESEASGRPGVQRVNLGTHNIPGYRQVVEIQDVYL